eukprot:gene32160-16694_t
MALFLPTLKPHNLDSATPVVDTEARINKLEKEYAQKQEAVRDWNRSNNPVGVSVESTQEVQLDLEEEVICNATWACSDRHAIRCDAIWA